jgi:hypothetical protein
MGANYDAGFVAGGWYEIRDPENGDRWIATDDPAEVTR